jgi:hypothetical protein
MANSSAEIAKFYASLGIKTNRNELSKVDRFLKSIEDRFKKSKATQLNLDRFKVDQKALNMALGTALDVASKTVTFEVSKFVVNDRNLQAALLRATRRIVPAPPRPGSGPNPPSPDPRPPGSRSTVIAGRGYGGGMSRLYAPALALAAGGYGLAALNRRNQQVVSAQLQSQAVVQQAGGTASQGNDSFQYLRSEANRIGFNYLDASPDYNKLISGLTGSGVSLGKSQKVFSGFAELARVNKLDKTTQNRLFRALSQVAGKGKLQSEELTGQIAEALPGGTALFAQAYQKQIGGNKTGQAAIQELLAQMKKGKVTSEILTYAGDAASLRANEGGALAKAGTASQAEQFRYQNSVNDLAVVASDSGVESGFARIFRTLNDGLSQSAPLVRSLAEGFDEITIKFRALALLPQSFQRMLDGKDSLITKLIGDDKASEVRQLFADMETFGRNFSDLTSNIGNGWKMIFEQINGISSLNLTQNLQRTMGIGNNILGAVNSAADGNFATAGSQLGQAGKGFLQGLTIAPRFLGDTAGSALGFGDNAFSGLLGLDGKATVASSLTQNPQSANNTVSIQIGDVNIQSSATNIEGVNADIQAQMKDAFQNAWSEANLNWVKSGR